MTYGEACFLEQESEDLVNGEFVITRRITNKPKPMKPEDAVKYYNTKLFKYWLTQMDENIKEKNRTELLKFMMFGRHGQIKLITEEITACGN